MNKKNIFKIIVYFTIILVFFPMMLSAAIFLDGTEINNPLNIDEGVRKFFSKLEEDVNDAVNTENMRTSVNTATNIISGRLSSVVSPHSASGTPQKLTLNNSGDYFITGLSAGDSPGKFGVWCNLSFTSTENTREETESDSRLGMGILGIDYQISSNFLAGLALSYENNDQKTRFNKGNIDQDGISLIPYAAFLINNMFSLDVTAGYAWLDVDQERNDGADRSSFDSERWFVSGNMHGYFSMAEKTNLMLTAGYTFSKEDRDNNSFNPEETTELGTINIGTELSHLVNNNCELYANISYNYDTTYEKPSKLSYDRNGFPIGGGVRFLTANNLSLDANIAIELGRKYQEQLTGMLNIRYEF